jgi:hypothetical protein
MVDQQAMRKLIARRHGDVATWRAEHDVTEDGLELVVLTYGRDQESAAAAVEAFLRGIRGWRECT